MSLADFADRLSQQLGTAVDKSAIARVERRERGVKVDEAVGMARVLQLPLMALLDGEDDRSADIRHAQSEVEDAELLLRAAENDVARCESVLEQARQRLEQLEHQEIAEDLRLEQ